MPSTCVAQGEKLIKINVFTDSRCPLVFGPGLHDLPGVEGSSSPPEKGSLAFPGDCSKASLLPQLEAWAIGVYKDGGVWLMKNCSCSGKHADSSVGVAASERRPLQRLLKISYQMHSLWGVTVSIDKLLAVPGLASQERLHPCESSLLGSVQ